MDTMRGHDVTDDGDDFDFVDDEAIETPLRITSDERRMQVRAYNYWTSLLGHRSLPSIEDLSPEELEDFGPNSVLLDFSTGLDDPSIVYLGAALREECGIDGAIHNINDVPARSLLSRLTDHYLQVVANEAPIGFEAEFVNQRGVEILYRGILMPFSSDDQTIDFAFGVINWKVMADSAQSKALEQEITQALLTAPPTPRSASPLWAEPADPVVPSPSTAIAAQDLEDTLDLTGMEAPRDDASLADWLALARDGAEQVRTSEARSHAALYRAVGLAYDFALVAQARPLDYAELLADQGLKVQARSPMTAIIKLVFGTHYDKTRITEYATTLEHGLAMEMGVNMLAPYLADYPGGLKALVRDERARRRAKAPPRPDRHQAARSSMKQAMPIDPLSITTDEDGLAVVVACREEDGSLSLVAALAGGELSRRVIVKAGG